MINAVTLDDIIVDATILGIEEHLWLTLETSEILVGISIIGNETLSAITSTLKGEVNHILLCLLIIDGLWSPYPVGIAEVLLVVFLQHNFRVRPVHQVLRFHQYDARIILPSILHGVHIGSHDVIAAIFTTKDMRVADTATGTDRIAGDNRLVVVERIPVLGILADSKAKMLLLVTTTFEISKEIACKILLGSLLCRMGIHRHSESQCCHQHPAEC